MHRHNYGSTALEQYIWAMKSNLIWAMKRATSYELWRATSYELSYEACHIWGMQSHTCETCIICMNWYPFDYRLGALHSIHRHGALHSIRHTGLFRKWLTPRRARIRLPSHLNPTMGLFSMISYMLSNDMYYKICIITSHHRYLSKRWWESAINHGGRVLSTVHPPQQQTTHTLVRDRDREPSTINFHVSVR